MQIREEVAFTKGRIIVRGKLVTRGKAKRADYILYLQAQHPDRHHRGEGQQPQRRRRHAAGPRLCRDARISRLCFPPTATALSSTTAPAPAPRRKPISRSTPSRRPPSSGRRYRAWKGLTPEAEEIVLQDYFDDGSGKAPRYYQINAINAAIEAIAKGQDRVLLVMATGTGKTYTAFQIIWRLWKAGRKKRILFLADRNVLIDQTMVNDFRPFGAAMAKLSTGAKTIERAGRHRRRTHHRARQEAPDRHRLRGLSRPLSGHHRPGGAPEALPGVLAGLLRPDRHRRVPSRQRRRGCGLARNPRIFLRRDADRPHRHAEGNRSTSPTSIISASRFTPTR